MTLVGVTTTLLENKDEIRSILCVFTKKVEN